MSKKLSFADIAERAEREAIRDTKRAMLHAIGNTEPPRLGA